eukprot:gene21216-24078_t
MLTLDSNQVSRISLQRFAKVVENELAKAKSEAAPSNSLAWGTISTTLAHNLTTIEGDNNNTEILTKLRTQVKDVERVNQSSQRVPEVVVAEKPKTANVTEKTALANKVTKTLKEKHIAEETAAAVVADTASGERIQHLLQDQKDLSAKDLEVEQRTQAMLVNELTELTSMLKDSTIGINRAVKIQNIQLASMGVHAAENRDELEKQKQRMKESTQGMTSSIWSTVWTMLWVVGVFSATYAVIRLLPNRTVYPTCANPSSIDTRYVDTYRAAAGLSSELPTADVVVQDLSPKLVQPSASPDQVAEPAFDPPSEDEPASDEHPHDTQEPPLEQWETSTNDEGQVAEVSQVDLTGEEEGFQDESAREEAPVNAEFTSHEQDETFEPQLEEAEEVPDESSVVVDFDPAETSQNEDLNQENGGNIREWHEHGQENQFEHNDNEGEHAHPHAEDTKHFESREEHDGVVGEGEEVFYEAVEDQNYDPLHVEGVPTAEEAVDSIVEEEFVEEQLREGETQEDGHHDDYEAQEDIPHQHYEQNNDLQEESEPGSEFVHREDPLHGDAEAALEDEHATMQDRDPHLEHQHQHEDQHFEHQKQHEDQHLEHQHEDQHFEHQQQHEDQHQHEGQHENENEHDDHLHVDEESEQMPQQEEQHNGVVSEVTEFPTENEEEQTEDQREDQTEVHDFDTPAVETSRDVDVSDRAPSLSDVGRLPPLSAHDVSEFQNEQEGEIQGELFHSDEL